VPRGDVDPYDTRRAEGAGNEALPAEAEGCREEAGHVCPVLQVRAGQGLCSLLQGGRGEVFQVRAAQGLAGLLPARRGEGARLPVHLLRTDQGLGEVLQARLGEVYEMRS
jgi:hypothetical protein